MATRPRTWFWCRGFSLYKDESLELPLLLEDSSLPNGIFMHQRCSAIIWYIQKLSRIVNSARVSCPQEQQLNAVPLVGGHHIMEHGLCLSTDAYMADVDVLALPIGVFQFVPPTPCGRLQDANLFPLR
jgi:hypothetical protein